MLEGVRGAPRRSGAPACSERYKHWDKNENPTRPERLGGWRRLMERLKKSLWLILLFVTFAAVGQGAELSTHAQIAIITCGPSQAEVFLAFGHSAIRVYDPDNGIDDAYNYGVFDFNQPYFYLNYTRGLLLFKLGVYEYPEFVNSYASHNRWVTLQTLDLSQTQRQAVYNYLERNARPENETYRYDYFYNNCSSKVRDVFQEVLGDSIRFDGSYIKTHFTIRQLAGLYLKEQPWGRLGIDICLGLPMDKKATPYEYMFLPDFLESAFDHAFIRQNGIDVPIVKIKQPAYLSQPAAVPSSRIHPWVPFGGLFSIALALSGYDLRRRKISKWFDLILFSVTGLAGSLLIILWAATDHAAAANNFNLLWALPSHLLAVLIYRQESAAFLRKYFLGATALAALVLAGWSIVPQQLNVFLIPFVAALLCRSFVVARLL